MFHNLINLTKILKEFFAGAGLQTETGVEVGERGVEGEPPQHEDESLARHPVENKLVSSKDNTAHPIQYYGAMPYN